MWLGNMISGMARNGLFQQNQRANQAHNQNLSRWAQYIKGRMPQQIQPIQEPPQMVGPGGGFMAGGQQNPALPGPKNLAELIQRYNAGALGNGGPPQSGLLNPRNSGFR